MPYPNWISTEPRYNLREVAPGLFVGAVDSPSARIWGTIVDLYGHGAQAQGSPFRLSFPFPDGGQFPPHALDSTLKMLRATEGPMLIHCAAGLSRSVSAAYAMLVAHYELPRHQALRMARGLDPRFPVDSTLASAERWLRSKGL
jgi:protein-tyrosine phosphatase